MFKRILGAALVLGTAALAPPTAEAQMLMQACGPRDAIARHLEQKYGERQEGAGLMMNGSRLYELWFSDKTGSWTILLTRPGGTSCIVASGQDWRAMPAPVSAGDPA